LSTTVGELMIRAAILRAFLVGLVCVVLYPASAQDNLLDNPGFEEPFVEFDGRPVREVAEGWTPWHIAASPGAPTFENTQPEYYPAAPARDRIRSGSNAQEILSFFATFNGGVYQRVTNVPTGATLRFSAYAYVWSTTYDERDDSELDGDVTVEVGIDPTGGTDPNSITVVWSQPIEQYDEYNQYVVETEATGDTATVFVRIIVDLPVKHNHVYLDDAMLIAEGEGQPGATETVAASDTPQPATETATSTPDEEAGTATPTREQAPTDVGAVPTETDAATATSSPTSTATATPVPPSSTPVPASPTATNTVTAPTETVTPSATPVDVSPTVTLTPTVTPEGATATTESPTATFTPSATIAPETPTATLTPTQVPATATATPVSPTPTDSPISDEFPQTIIHIVRPGDTVAALAARYGSTTAAIAEANGLGSNFLIRVGQQLVIPIRAITVSPVPPADAVTYTVRPGDSLSRIARLFNTTVNALAQFNGIVNVNQIQVGQVLRIPRAGEAPPVEVLPPITSQRSYTVLPGDTLSRISLLFGISISELMEANDLTQTTIFVGQVLDIP
jgi:LysM repeat protein